MDDFERQRVLAHEAARLMAYAFHSPKEIPDYKPLSQRTQVGEPTAFDDARIHAFFTELALKGSR